MPVCRFFKICGSYRYLQRKETSGCLFPRIVCRGGRHVSTTVMRVAFRVFGTMVDRHLCTIRIHLRSTQLTKSPLCLARSMRQPFQVLGYNSPLVSYVVCINHFLEYLVSSTVCGHKHIVHLLGGRLYMAVRGRPFSGTGKWNRVV